MPGCGGEKGIEALSILESGDILDGEEWNIGSSVVQP